MNEEDVQTLKWIWFNVAAMQVHVTTVEAMKAENEYRVHRGETIAYGEDAFIIQAEHLNNIAKALANL